MSLREKILATDDRPFKDRRVEEWDETVRIRGLSAADAEKFSRSISGDGEESPNVMAGLLVLTLQDPETNEFIFGEKDAAALAQHSGQILLNLFRHAQELSGLGALEEAKND